MVGMRAALNVVPGLAGADLGEYRVGYISQAGTRHQVSLGRKLLPSVTTWPK